MRLRQLSAPQAKRVQWRRTMDDALSSVGRCVAGDGSWARRRIGNASRDLHGESFEPWGAVGPATLKELG